MSLYYTRVLTLDGVVVPATSVSLQFSAGDGTASIAVSLPATFEAERLQETTAVHIWHIQPNTLSVRRRVVDLPADAEANLNSLWAEQRRETIGTPFMPRVDLSAFGEGRSEPLLRSMPHHAMRYRFGGELIQVSDVTTAQQTQATLIVAPYDYLTAKVQAIQLIRGRGTFNEEERKYFGQDEPLFEGRGSRAFADGLTELLTDSEFGLQEGIRRLITEYAARINPMWANRWGWTRIPDLYATLDSDSSTDRLLDTRAFREVLRETMQQMYAVPLRNAVSAVLQFLQYRTIPVPSPAYFPLRIPDEPKTVVDTLKNDRVIPAGLQAEITIPERRVPAEPDPPPGFTLVEGSRRRITNAAGGTQYYWDATDGVDTIQLPAIYDNLFGYRTTAVVTGGGTTLEFEVPEGFNGGPGRYRIVLGAPSSVEFDSASGSSSDVVLDTLPLIAPRGSDAFAAVSSAGEVTSFRENSRYRFSFVNRADRIVEYPPSEVVVLADITAFAARTVRTLEEVPREVEPNRPRGLFPSTDAALTSYAMLPHLWWACPPACNFVVPENLLSVQVSKSTAEIPTRMLGKMAPGRSGGSNITMDKYSAPDLRELNVGISEPGEDLRDPTELYRAEYLWGPQFQVKYFDVYSRLAAEEDWEPFLRSYLHTYFWSLRLNSRTAEVQIRPDDRVVVGAPMLVLQPSDVAEYQTPEQRHWLDRIAALEAARRGMRACLSRLGTNRGLADRIREYIQSLYAIRGLLERTGGIPASATDTLLLDLINTTSTYTIADIESGEVTLSRISRNIRSAITAGARSGELAGANTVLQEGNELQIRFSHPVLDGSTNGYVLGNPFDSGSIRQLIPGDERAVETLTTNSYAGTTYPSFAELQRWYDVVESNIYDPSACRAALQRDIALVEDALRDARAELRALGVAPGIEKSFVGYVESLSETSTPEGTQLAVRMTHVRYIGEDLDWDGLGSDDPEAVIAFGTDGFVDDRYRIDRIGTDVYAPIFGCESLADLPEVQQYLARQDEDDADNTDVQGLPPRDASDIFDQFEHPEACGENCAAEVRGPVAGLNLTAVASALIEAYRQRRRTGDGETIHDWLETIRVRPTLTMADAYRGMPVLSGGPQEPDVRTEFRGDDEAYPDGRLLQGFWYRSFLGVDDDTDRLRVLARSETGEDEFLDLTDDELDLFRTRKDRILAYFESILDRTIVRFQR